MANKTSDLIFRLIGKDETGPATKSAARNLDGVGDASKRLHGSLGNLQARAALASAALGGLAVAGAVAGVKAATKASSELGESMNAVNVIFGDASAGIKAIGATSSTALGLSRTEFNQLAVRFSSFATTVAGDGGNVAGVMKDLTGRAADFASVMNLDVSTAAELFQSGLAGETEPLRAYGIDLSAATVEAYALSHGIADGSGQLTEQQKVMARYALLMESTNKTAGDFRNTQGGLANQSRILHGQWTDLLAVSGQLFTPLAEAVLPKLNLVLGDLMNTTQANMPALREGATEVGQKLSALLDKVVAGVPRAREELAQVAGVVKDNWPDIVQTAENLGSALQRVGEFTGAMWTAFKSLPPEVQQIIALLAVAQKTGVLSVAFKVSDVVGSMLKKIAGMSIQAGVVNVAGAAGGGGVVPGGKGVGAVGTGAALGAGTVATLAIAAATIEYASFKTLDKFPNSEKTKSDARPGDTMGQRQNIATFTSAGGQPGTAGMGSMIAAWTYGAGRDHEELLKDISRQESILTQRHYDLAAAARSSASSQSALTQAVEGVAKQSNLAGWQVSVMGQAVASLPSGASADQIAAAIQSAGKSAGLSDDQISAFTEAVLAVPTGTQIPALTGAVAAAGQSAGLTADQLAFMSQAVAAVPPGASVQQMRDAITQAGQAAGLSQQQIDLLTASVNVIPASANLPALAMAIAVAGANSGMSKQQVDALSAAVAAVPPGATAGQMGEAIRVAGEKAGLTDLQIQGVTAAVNAIPPSKDVPITTTAPQAQQGVNSLQGEIDRLTGTSVDIKVHLSASNPNGFSDAATLYYGGGGGAAETRAAASRAAGGVIGRGVEDLAKSLAPDLVKAAFAASASSGSYMGPGSGPLGRPLYSYNISDVFGSRGGGHMGIDLAAPIGQAIYAPAAGLVTMAGWNGGYGYFTSIDHGGGLTTHFGHQSALLVSAGQVVAAGQQIGLVGTTGDSTGPHLHFEVLRNGSYVDPASVIGFARGGMVHARVSNGETYVSPRMYASNPALFHAINRIHGRPTSGDDMGIIRGPGTGTSDSIRAMLPAGSFIINERATRQSRALLNSIMSGRGFADGGVVGGAGSVSVPAGGRTVVEFHLDGRMIKESLVRHERAVGVG